MANQITMTKNGLSLLVVPSASDMAVWQGITPVERKAVFINKAHEAVASPHLSMTAEEVIAEAKAELEND